MIITEQSWRFCLCPTHSSETEKASKAVEDKAEAKEDKAEAADAEKGEEGDVEDAGDWWGGAASWMSSTVSSVSQVTLLPFHHAWHDIWASH